MRKRGALFPLFFFGERCFFFFLFLYFLFFLFSKKKKLLYSHCEDFFVSFSPNSAKKSYACYGGYIWCWFLLLYFQYCCH